LTPSQESESNARPLQHINNRLLQLYRQKYIKHWNSSANLTKRLTSNWSESECGYTWPNPFIVVFFYNFFLQNKNWINKEAHRCFNSFNLYHIRKLFIKRNLNWFRLWVTMWHSILLYPLRTGSILQSISYNPKLLINSTFSHKIHIN